MLLSKVLARRDSMGPRELTSALLRTKGVRHLRPKLAASGPEGPIGCWSKGFAAAQAALFLNLQNPGALSISRRLAPLFRAVYLCGPPYSSR
jgi:hypothetical protein